MEDTIITIYTYKITKGKFKGKIVRSYDSNAFVWGISPMVLSCFDDESDYLIYWDELEQIGEPEVIKVSK